jgi:hypothetical protein
MGNKGSDLSEDEEHEEKYNSDNKSNVKDEKINVNIPIYCKLVQTPYVKSPSLNDSRKSIDESLQPDSYTSNNFQSLMSAYNLEYFTNLSAFEQINLEKPGIIKSISIVHYVNDNLFPVSITINNLVFEYNFTDFINKIINETTKQTEILQSFLNDPKFKKSVPIQISLKNNDKNRLKKTKIHEISNNMVQFTNIINTIPNKKLYNFFLQPNVYYDSHDKISGPVIIPITSSIIKPLLNLSILQLDISAINKSEPKTPRNTENHIFYSINKKNVSIIKYDQSKEEKSGIKVESGKIYNDSLISFFNNYKLNLLTEISQFKGVSVIINTSPSQESLIKQIIGENLKISPTKLTYDDTFFEFCNLVIEIKFFFI